MSKEYPGPAAVLLKLLAFSVAIVVLPITVVRLTLVGYLDPIVVAVFGSDLKHSRPTAAGALGTLAVLGVMAAYVVMAMLEPAPVEEKKQD
ncbi:hypothetical protein WJX73_008516 [Symbiochloris irregularis]|uniref:Uncharacterized protein n=1 Tax=Symbiochloris irregularis TaxID=706552 RepID=A0AAW1PQY9_9CHLO